MKRIFVSLFFVFFCICYQASAYSQTLYSLHDLCLNADKNAETIKIATDDLFIAEQDKQRALSVLIPTATSYGSYLHYKNGNIVFPNSTTIGAKLTQSFTLNGRELIAYDISKKGINKAQFSRESTRANYLFQVAQSYFQILSAKRQVEIAQADVERLKTHKISVQEKLSVGNVTKTDLYRAEAELSKSLTDTIVAENSVGQNKATLVRLAGIEDNFRVSAKDVQDMDNFTITLDEIKAQALNSRYEIKEAQKTLEIASQTIRYEKGDYWPSLALEGGYKKSDVYYNTNGGHVDYDDETTYIQADLVFTLYDGGLRKAQVRQAKAKERQAQQALSLEKKQVVYEAKVSFLEFETARNTLVNLQDELKSAQENFNAVQMQFKYGTADSIDMMDANTLLTQAEQRISNAEYTYSLAILKILYTKGDLLTYLLTPA
ncbi:MAG: TolC family protein [Desulfobacteraceae bacterium]|nr:TolC family protein [Desulfobacteraceae bacterium]